MLSPATLHFAERDYDPPQREDLHFPPYMTAVQLTDGGVYDSLGLETAWKRYTTVLMSDGGGKMGSEEEVNSDWVRHTLRILNLVDNQVRSLRKRHLLDSYNLPCEHVGHRDGAYWGIRTDIADYGLGDSLPCQHEQTLTLANLPTRLGRLDDATQERLVNWGYASCDAAIRRYVDSTLRALMSFPYPHAGVG
jgi:NTE family protein